ncbi:programmed cell death 1 ligand 2-like isoform X2 [Sceloporus undulatus]|uniref:programmed cell death 1 ligand 2-like isoform X2 n=1 Tax=Sceloporus undulatus TaxID=8520 RepID=UPI001C4B281D|nr:programmed cell death 1 ligand 2-like isoform X2 [Sceloporus undulatus]
MFGPLLIVLLQIQLHFITALFTVDVLQPRYSAEHGSNVTMGCRFPVRDPFNLTALSILWQKKHSEGHDIKEVYKLSKGQENLRQQHTDYRGRASLLLEELKMGYSMLHINNVKVTDAGIYVCLVHDEGVDFKYINLDVEARYKIINFQERKEEEDLILTCQSEGYPLAEVSWHNENANLSTSAVTTYQLTDDGLFSITSTLRVKSFINGNYSCVFWNRELNEKTSAHGPSLEHGFTNHSVMRTKPFTNWRTQKDKRRRTNKLSREEDMNLQTKNLNASTVTD